MPKFRKKPVVIEAIQFTEEAKNQCFNFVTCTREPCWDVDGRPTLKIQTLEGDMIASIDDWIIKGVKGEFYPIKDDIFAATYELAEPSSYIEHVTSTETEPDEPK